MALLWGTFEALIILFYWELPQIQKQIQGDFLKAQVHDTYHRHSEHTVQDALSPNSAATAPDNEHTPNTQDISAEAHYFENSPMASPEMDPPDSADSNRLKTPPINAARRPIHPEVMLTSSNEMIETAERFMLTPEATDGSPPDLFFDSSHFGVSSAESGGGYRVRDGRAGHGESDGRRNAEDRSRVENTAPSGESSSASTALWGCKFFFDGTSSLHLFAFVLR